MADSERSEEHVVGTALRDRIFPLRAGILFLLDSVQA
jgi:hypothetical protein